VSEAQPAPLPRQIAYIIGNEGCERFSFYGMRNVLTVFLVSVLLLDLPAAEREGAAKEVFHTFVIGVYFFPLLGGWLADRYFGKFKVILGLSVLYTFGHLLLALSESWRPGFYAGLGLIALGSGGIKPCVSAFVGDQFDASNRHRAKVVFDAFYWIINFGSFFATLLVPYLLQKYGPSVAFGVPGVLMALATVILWMGRHLYVQVPPAPADPDSPLRVAWTALWAPRPQAGRPGLWVAGLGVGLGIGSLALIGEIGFVASLCLSLVLILGLGGLGTGMQLDRARGAHPEEAVQGLGAVLRLLVLFALVMLLIPFNNLLLYPLLGRWGLTLTPLRKMTAGIVFSGLAWIAVGALQLQLDGGAALSILWQLLPYVLLTLGEVLVSTTGLEFAYSQAPLRAKSALMSLWSLAVTVGNLWVLLVNSQVKSPALTGWVEARGLGVTAAQMFFFAGFALAAALAFGLYARGFVSVDRYRPVTK